jgi:hypothetical protein
MPMRGTGRRRKRAKGHPRLVWGPTDTRLRGGGCGGDRQAREGGLLVARRVGSGGARRAREVVSHWLARRGPASLCRAAMWWDRGEAGRRPTGRPRQRWTFRGDRWGCDTGGRGAIQVRGVGRE